MVLSSLLGPFQRSNALCVASKLFLLSIEINNSNDYDKDGNDSQQKL